MSPLNQCRSPFVPSTGSRPALPEERCTQLIDVQCDLCGVAFSHLFHSSLGCVARGKHLATTAPHESLAAALDTEAHSFSRFCLTHMVRHLSRRSTSPALPPPQCRLRIRFVTVATRPVGELLPPYTNDSDAALNLFHLHEAKRLKDWLKRRRGSVGSVVRRGAVCNYERLKHHSLANCCDTDVSLD